MKRFKLKFPAIFILFITSYIPLFLLLIIRQFKQNYDYLNYSEPSEKSVLCFCERFGLSALLLTLILIGLFGLRNLLKNFQENIDNGYLVKVIEVDNKNSESIAYISTYIVPFIFQDTNNYFDIVSILLLLILIFLIYSKSNMIVINPILSIKYTIYQLSFSKTGTIKKGFLISPIEELEEHEELKINSISKDIYYGHKTTIN